METITITFRQGTTIDQVVTWLNRINGYGAQALTLKSWDTRDFDDAITLHLEEASA